VAKFLQIVAFLLIGDVLCVTQCVETCSFLAVRHEAKTSQPKDHAIPCHHQQEESRPPASHSFCFHNEFVAEKVSKLSSNNDLQASHLVSMPIEAHIDLVIFSSPLVVVDAPVHRFSPLLLSSILRI